MNSLLRFLPLLAFLFIIAGLVLGFFAHPILDGLWASKVAREHVRFQQLVAAIEVDSKSLAPGSRQLSLAQFGVQDTPTIEGILFFANKVDSTHLSISAVLDDHPLFEWNPDQHIITNAGHPAFLANRKMANWFSAISGYTVGGGMLLLMLIAVHRILRPR